MQMIPRIIHQIYFRGDIPADLARNVEKLKALNPNWEHRLWNAESAEQFIQSSYGDDALQAYRRIDPSYGAARSDLLRHMIMHEFGGVYFDIKSGADKPLEAGLRPDDRYVLAQWPDGHPSFYPHRALAHIEGGEYVTWFIAAIPGHPFSAATISRMLRNIRTYRPWSSVGRTGAIKLGGPIAYTLAVSEIISEHPHRVATFEELGLYYSIDYDHVGAFPQHYSCQTAPVVKLGPIGSAISRAIWRVVFKLRSAA